MSVKETSQIIEIYRKRAKNFEFFSNFYFLIGYRWKRDQRDAVNALKLSKGDTVVDLGCGTGLNFPLLMDLVGPNGKIIGVDITDKMLDQAKIRVEEKGWNNVELVLCDVAEYKIPKGVDGIIATGVLTFSPSYDQVIKNGYEALKSGKRFVLTEFKMSAGSARFFAPILIFISQSLGVQKKWLERHPWKSIEKYFDEHYYKESYGGYACLSVGIKS